MTISTNAAGGVAFLNNPNANQLEQALAAMGFGGWVRTMPVQRHSVVPAAAAANPYVLAAAQSVTLPDDAKACKLLSGYARAGTGTKGALVVVTDSPETFGGAEPIAGRISVSPSGDLLVNHVDAWTKIDFLYIPAKYDVQELVLPVVTNVLTLPTALKDVVGLFEVEAMVGTSVGKKIIDVVGTAPAAGHAALSLDKLTVAFQATDAVTSARVKFGTLKKIGSEEFLENAQPYFP